jgi:predicted Zn-dependent protease with MMP-like domain
VPGPPTLRRILLCALGALCVGLGLVSLVSGFSNTPLVRLLQGAAVWGAGAAVLGAVIVVALVRLGDWREPQSEREFEALVRRSEWLATTAEPPSPGDGSEDFTWEDGPATTGEAEFRALVRTAIDELPLEFHRALEYVAIVISDEGWRYGAYGLYQGDTIARDHFHDHILIFRDTLTRDFGHDPDLLARQVRRTVRHELGHHLGWDERGVRRLGL